MRSKDWTVSGSIPGTDLAPQLGKKTSKSSKSQPKEASNASNKEGILALTDAALLYGYLTY